MAKQVQIVLCMLVGLAVSTYNGYDPPKNGSFFYMGLTTDGTQKKRYSTTISLGTENEDFKVLFTTNLYQVQIVTRDCPDYLCNTPKSIDTSSTHSYYKLDNILSLDYPISLYDKNNRVVTVKFTGAEWESDIKYKFDKYHREFTLPNQQFSGITSSSVKIVSQTSGFIGIRPYTSNLNYQD